MADADKLARDDARYYAIQLEVASQAIKGLEQEYLEILVEAAHCELNNEEQRRHLRMRIDTYMIGEVLRPELKEAIGHLREGREALQQNAERLLIWPQVRKNRVAALGQYDQLVGQVTDYLGSLGDYSGSSAVCLSDLRNIHAAASGSPELFADLVA